MKAVLQAAKAVCGAFLCRNAALCRFRGLLQAVICGGDITEGTAEIPAQQVKRKERDILVFLQPLECRRGKHVEAHES